MTPRSLPDIGDLTRAQTDGWACVWCQTRLWVGAQSAGRAKGMLGQVPWDVEVYACPNCADSPPAGR